MMLVSKWCALNQRRCGERSVIDRRSPSLPSTLAKSAFAGQRPECDFASGLEELAFLVCRASQCQLSCRACSKQWF
jgi:hypothetical protein